MNTATIKTLLTNSGLKVINIDDNFISFEDPSCIFPAFDTVLNYAWFVIVFLTGIMLFGWAVLYIFKGVKLYTISHNAKSLFLIFTILALVKPIVNVVYGDNLFAQQCEVRQVSRAQVDELLNLRNKNLGSSDEYLLNKDFDTDDSEQNTSSDVE